MNNSPNHYHWTLGWSGDVELGVGNGYYLPREAAIVLHPEYFDEQGNPILTALPIVKPISSTQGK